MRENINEAVSFFKPKMMAKIKVLRPIVLVLWVILIASNFSAYSQSITDTTQHLVLPTIAQVNQGNSYITFPTDIGNLQPLWFEGNIIPNFFLRQSRNSRLLGVLTPQIIIRMYQEESFPVRTPSYIPQITVYYQICENPNQNKMNLFARIAHHSNGQEESFFLENREVNTRSGDFATNYLELGLIKTNYSRRFNAHQFFKTSLEYHPKPWMALELDGIYSNFRWHNSFSIFKLPSKSVARTSQHSDISLKLDATWLFGNVNDWQPVSWARLNLSLVFYYHPRFLEDIGLFVQYYSGSDYYNIYFGQHINVLRFGIMTDILSF